MITRWLILLFALAQIGVPLLPRLGIGRDIGAAANAVTTAATPADYAFSIWGVIFALNLAFAIYQLRRSGDPLVEAVRAPLTVAFFANALWIVWVQFGGISWGSMGIILAGAGAALLALYRASNHRTRLLSMDEALVKAPVGLLAGWLTVAVFANYAAAAKQAGFDPLSLGDETQAAVLVGKAGAFAALFAWASRGNPWYALASAWGLIAVIAANTPEGPRTVVAVAALGLALVLGALVLGWRRKARDS